MISHGDRTRFCIWYFIFFYLYIWYLHCYYLFQLKNLLRKVLDPYALTLQSAQLTRNWNYNDETQRYDLLHPSNVPEWSYFQQKGQEFDTDIEGKYIKKCLICWNFMVTNTSSFHYFFLYRRKWRTPRWTLRWLLWI